MTEELRNCEERRSRLNQERRESMSQGVPCTLQLGESSDIAEDLPAECSTEPGPVVMMKKRGGMMA